jgi:hypothetical protein
MFRFALFEDISDISIPAGKKGTINKSMERQEYQVTKRVYCPPKPC